MICHVYHLQRQCTSSYILVNQYIGVSQHVADWRGNIVSCEMHMGDVVIILEYISFILTYVHSRTDGHVEEISSKRG